MCLKNLLKESESILAQLISETGMALSTLVTGQQSTEKTERGNTPTDKVIDHSLVTSHQWARGGETRP